MNDDKRTAPQADRAASLKAEREARLAKALRDNLRRRKGAAPIRKSDNET